MKNIKKVNTSINMQVSCSTPSCLSYTLALKHLEKMWPHIQFDHLVL